MRGRLVRLVVENAGLKAISLVAALTLFAVVRGESESRTAGFVRVAYRLPEDRVLVSDPPVELKVRVEGSRTAVARLDDRELPPIEIDLRHVHDGPLKLRPDDVHLPGGLHATSLLPAELSLRFDRKARRALPVHPVLAGEPAPGFRAGAVRPAPASIELEGAASELARLDAVDTEPVRLGGARVAVSRRVRVAGLPPHVRPVQPQWIQVSVQVAHAIDERALLGLDVAALGLSRSTARVLPERADVVLRGPRELIEAVRREQLDLAVDLRLEDGRPPATYQKKLVVGGLPPGVAAEVRPHRVTVTLQRRR